MNLTFYDSSHPLSADQLEKIIDFLFQHLERFGDPHEDIRKAIAYAMMDDPYTGGFVCTASQADELIGAVVVNRTGMDSYIPENILVYIAVHGAYRGKGLGRQLMEVVIDRAQGGIALHVEADNPARRLYEKLGFTNKYLEMRLCRKEAP